MPISVVCPTCAAKLRAPDKAAGRSTRCPKCGSVVVVPGESAAAPEAARTEQLPQPVTWPEAPMAVPSPPVAPVAPAPPTVNVDYGQPAPFGAASAVVSNTIIVQQPSRAAHSFGIASLVVGILSFFTLCIPGVGMVVSGLGLGLGVIGILLAVFRRGSGAGFAIAGCGLSGLSLLIGVLWTLALGRGIMGLDAALRERKHVSQEPDGGAAASGNQGNVAGNDQQKPAFQPTKTEPAWVDASKGPVRHGDLQVRVEEVIIGKVPLQTLNGKSVSRDQLLAIKLELVNLSPTKKLDYRTWSGREFSVERDYATLSDNFGNSYKRIGFGLGTHPEGAVRSFESIYPTKSITEVLVFEEPVDTFEYLRLELPAGNFGSTGMIRLQIPKAMVRR